MNVNKRLIKVLKNTVLIASTVVVFASASSTDDDKIKDENNNYILTQSTDSEIQDELLNNLSISKEQYDFYSNLKSYENKTADEIAVMFSMNKTIDELNDILFIAPLSKNKYDERNYDNIAMARYICRDLLSDEFHNNIIESLNNADSIDWNNSNNSTKVLNISNQIYNSMNNYIEAWNKKDITNLIQNGIAIKNCLLKFQPLDFFMEKIDSKNNYNINLIYIGNNNPDSIIRLSDDSLIKQYYDLSIEDDNIPTWSLNVPCLSFYTKNYFKFLMEEYEIESNQEMLYAELVSNKQKTLS